MVLCQHSHRIGCYEEYQGGFILYGQGNMLLPWGEMSDEFRVGALLDLNIRAGGAFSWRLEFFQQEQRWTGKTPYVTHIDAESERGRSLQNALEARNEILKDENRLAEEWSRFCSTRKFTQWSALMMHGRVRARLNRFGWLQRKRSAALRRAALNLVRCESHREAFLSVAEDEWRQSTRL